MYSMYLHNCYHFEGTKKSELWLSIITEELNKNLTAHNWQNWKKKKNFPSCCCHEIYRIEAVGLKNYNYAWKIDILPIPSKSKFESENSFSHMLLI